jgi:MSHA biogenesis protein MshI
VLARFKNGLFRRATGNGMRAGVALADGRFALAVVSGVGSDKPTIEHCETHLAPGDIAPALKSALDKAKALRVPTCAVIDSDDYQIVQVEAPEVLPSEMRAAIRWRLRDAINFSVDEAAVDVFQIPDPVRRTQNKMLFAVAARESAIQRVTAAVKPAARGFNAIDIPELCLRNLAAILPQEAKGVAMLALHEKNAQLVVTRQGVMYLTRNIDNIRNGGAFNPHQTQRTDNEIDPMSLALELQRSLDYYESHYDQTPIGDLVIAPADERAHKLADALKQETSLRVSVLDARTHFNVRKSGELVTDWPCLMALGAALRDDRAEA